MRKFLYLSKHEIIYEFLYYVFWIQLYIYYRFIANILIVKIWKSYPIVFIYSVKSFKWYYSVEMSNYDIGWSWKRALGTDIFFSKTN